MLNLLIGFIVANIKYVILILAGIFVFNTYHIENCDHNTVNTCVCTFYRFYTGWGYWSPQKSLIQRQHSVQAKM